MSIKKILALLLAAAMVLGLGPAALASEDPAGLYEQGRDAFHAGDMESALELFTAAAEAGEVKATGMLAYMYLTGEGTEADPELAFKWASQGAEQGYAYAQGILGNMYITGEGVEQDPELARQWFEKAAAQDDITSVLSLGQMYELGEGVEQDGAKAAELYQRGLTWGTITAFTGSPTCTGMVLPWSRTMTRPCAFTSLSWMSRPRMSTGPTRL